MTNLVLLQGKRPGVGYGTPQNPNPSAFLRVMDEHNFERVESLYVFQNF